jgi:hypothetical protein
VRTASIRRPRPPAARRARDTPALRGANDANSEERRRQGQAGRLRGAQSGRRATRRRAGSPPGRRRPGRATARRPHLRRRLLRLRRRPAPRPAPAAPIRDAARYPRVHHPMTVLDVAGGLQLHQEEVRPQPGAGLGIEENLETDCVGIAVVELPPRLRDRVRDDRDLALAPLRARVALLERSADEGPRPVDVLAGNSRLDEVRRGRQRPGTRGLRELHLLRLVVDAGLARRDHGRHFLRRVRPDHADGDQSGDEREDARAPGRAPTPAW